ncbi:MAG TPA: hypothetical protein VF618_19850 [Thermoanaerobaculia bacterium]
MNEETKREATSTAIDCCTPEERALCCAEDAKEACCTSGCNC